ncbi:MAG: MtrB/PioB family decaheme-associated outer membrane protein [Pseudomonadota bacterium]
MNLVKQNFDFRKTLVSLAVIAACAPVYAQDAEVAELIRPESSISIGVDSVSGNQRDRALFGQYNGMRDNGTSVNVDLDINKRDDATGTSVTIKGRNLGLDNRDLSVTHEKQGDWKYGFDYSELVRHDPRTVNTGLLGAGSTTPTVVRLATPGTGTDYNFQIKRVGLGLMGEKWITPNLQFEVTFKNEDKDGARLFAKGFTCSASVPGCNTTQSATNQTWALLMLPEPINSTTKQIETKLNYSRDNLNLTAGYYGSFFTNDNGNIRATVPNVLNNFTAGSGGSSNLSGSVGGIQGITLQNVMQQAVALQPDNQAHQFYVSGSYRISPTVNSTFKYAYTHATQNEDFASMGLTSAPAGVTSLNGVVDTTLAQFGLTARPSSKLSLLANLRYEDKDDKTPKALYNTENGTTFWYNGHTSTNKITGKLEASYQLPVNLRATLGLDYNSLKREVPTSIAEENVAGLVALRARNEEKGYRLELRRTMSETLTGSVAYSNSRRNGSDWTSLAAASYGQLVSATQLLATTATATLPMNMVNVDREKFKLSANWTPTDQIEIQFNAEDGTDKNATDFNAIAGGKGWRESSNRQYSLDASYAVSDNWKLTGYVSQGNQNLKINRGVDYIGDLATRSDGLGFGVTGKISSKLEVGAQLMYLKDTTKYGMVASPTATGAAPSANNLAQVAIGLPDVNYQSTRISLYGTYAVDKKSSVRVNLIHQRTSLDEWTWGYNGVPFVYSDNTTVNMNQNQDVTLLGIAYIYKF